MLLSGIFPPITTPFYSEGTVYYKKLEANVEHYSRTPVAGIVVQGSTGEAIMLSDEERRQVLKTARDAAADQKVLIAGTGIESAHETLHLTEYAAEIGYDVAMIRTPHFYKSQMQPAQMLAFYRTVADHSPLPVILYSVPQFTGYDIPAEIVVELADHPNIIGIKESSGSVEKVRRLVAGTRHVKRSATVTETFAVLTPRMLKAASRTNGGELVPVAALAGNSKESAEPAPARPLTTSSVEGRASRPSTLESVEQRPSRSSSTPSSAAVTVVGGLKTRQKEVGFQILVGAANTLKASLDAGAAGAILAFADPAPTACYEIYAAWKEGDHELAQLKQERIAKASERVVGSLGIPGVKYAMDLNGYFGGMARLPLLPLTADLKAEVEQLMADIRN
jgi:4-hydroxy-2-oxoglutarate aldolase